MPTRRALWLLLVLAGLARAGEPERDVRLSGTIRLDGRPWAGGRARLQPLQRGVDLPEGPPIDVVADGRGEFVVQVPSLACRLQAGPGWPEGAAVRCDAQEAPSWPGRPLVWIRWATNHGTIHGEDEPLHVEVFSPVLLVGQALDARGAPVAGARALLVEDERERRAPTVPPLEVQTDGEGLFALRVPAWVRRWRAHVEVRSGERVAAASLGFEWNDGALELPRPVTLRLADLVPCAGRVVDLDGRPVAGARVRAVVSVVDARPELRPAREDDEPLPVDVRTDATTDAAGTFRLALPAGSGGLPCGPACASVALVVSALEFEPARRSLAVGPRSAPCVVTLARSGVTLVGRVVRHDGQPAWGATVRSGRAETTTAADGGFVLVGPEQRDLLVRAPGHAPRALRVRSRPGPGADAPLVIALRPGATIAGRVVDERGAPAGGLRVVVEPAVHRLGGEPLAPLAPGSQEELPALALGDPPLSATRTGEDGAFRVDGLPAGEELRVRSAGAEALLAAGGEAEVVLRRLSEAKLRGRAVRTEDGAPVAAEWRLSAPGWSTSRGPGSLLETEVSRGAPLEVTVEAPGRLPAQLGPVEVPAEGLDLGEVALEPAGRLVLDVRWPDVPVRGLEVEWEDASGVRAGWLVPARRAGQPSRLDGLGPGPVELRLTALPSDWRAEPLGTRTVRAVVRLGEGTRVEVDLSDLR